MKVKSSMVVKVSTIKDKIIVLSFREVDGEEGIFLCKTMNELD